MLSFLGCVFLSALLTPVCGQYHGSYYDPIDDSLTGDPFRAQLTTLLNNGTVILGYHEVFKAFEVIDYKPVDSSCGDIKGIYSSKCWDKSQECGSYKKEGDCFNREHFWPKSWWGAKPIAAYTDLHHLYPTDGYVNNQRSDKPLGKVTTVQYNSTNGCLVGLCSASENNGYSGECFEPDDLFKGEAARVYFYMATRYHDIFTCCSEPGVEKSTIKPWMQQTLRKWHQKFPPSPEEVERNDRIFSIQKNRNPFTDFPQWVDKVPTF